MEAIVEPVYYIYLNELDVIVGGGRCPDRANFDEFVLANPMAGAELLETPQSYTFFLNHTYNRETGEVTPPEQPSAPAPGSTLRPSLIGVDELIAALDEKDHGNSGKWQALLAKSKEAGSGDPP